MVYMLLCTGSQFRAAKCFETYNTCVINFRILECAMRVLIRVMRCFGCTLCVVHTCDVQGLKEDGPGASGRGPASAAGKGERPMATPGGRAWLSGLRK